MAYCCRNDLANATRQLKEEIDNLFTSYLRSTRDLVTKVHCCIVNTYSHLQMNWIVIQEHCLVSLKFTFATFWYLSATVVCKCK